jgi:hypothetical protein
MPVQSPARTKNHINYLFWLDSDGVLKKSDGASTQVISAGVRSFQTAHWAGAECIFYVTDNNALYSSQDATNWNFQGGNIQSIGVGEFKGGNAYLFSLTTGGLLQESTGQGWQPVTLGVKSFQVAPWAGKNYVFYLTNGGTLFSSFDGLNWANQGSHFTSFALGSMQGLDTLFALTSGGVLQRSVGNGWQTVASGIQSFQMAEWAASNYVFYLDSAGTLFSSPDGIHWANQGGPFQSFAVGSIQGTDELFALTAAGVLEQSTGSGYQTVASGVESFQMARWAGENFVFYLDSSATLFTSFDDVNWSNQGGPFQSFAVGRLQGVDYLFGLRGDGTLQRSTGNGWQTVASGVQSFQMARWAGAVYAFYLDNTNTLYTSPDGLNWTNQGGGITAFSVISLGAVDELFALSAAGTLQRSFGNGWLTVAGGVKAFQTSFWAGTNSAFYLTFGGTLYSSPDGANWSNQGSGIQAFAVGELNGRGTLFALTAAEVLQRSIGNGWQTVASGVRSMQMGFWAGENTVFYLSQAYTLFSSPDGVNWSNQGGPMRTFAVGSLQGIHSLFALTAGGVLQQSTGSGWNIVATAVVSFQMARWAGANYVFYSDSFHTLQTSPDGANWTQQDTLVQSFAVGNLRGNNELFDLSITGVFKQSIGGGWNTVSGNVDSFKMGDWAGANYVIYLTSGGTLLSSFNGASWTNQANNIASFELGNLAGANELFGLYSGGLLQRSTGNGWQTVAFDVRALQMGSWAGSNEVFYQDDFYTLFSSADGINFANQGSNILSFAVTTLNGVDYLFALTTSGVLQRSTGNFWISVATNVRFFILNSSNGVPFIEYFTFTKQAYTSADGFNWVLV